MIEGNDPPPPDPGSHERYGESLVYDVSKFLVSVSLLALGGMLTVSGTAPKGEIKLPTLAVAKLAPLKAMPPAVDELIQTGGFDLTK